jgi:hypothetical protein
MIKVISQRRDWARGVRPATVAVDHRLLIGISSCSEHAPSNQQGCDVSQSRYLNRAFGIGVVQLTVYQSPDALADHQRVI